jgi:L-asparaginase II
MRVTGGRLIAKTGAEGLLCIGQAAQGRGMAVKIADGSTRALGALTVRVLEQRGWITAEEASHPLLADLRHPCQRLPSGEVLSEIRVVV